MVVWEFVNNDEKKQLWLNNLNNYKESNYFQSELWAKTKDNWRIFRFLAYENKKIIGSAQFCVRYLPFSCCLAWCQGGPLGDVSIINNNLIKKCIHEFGCSRVYIRISPMILFSDQYKNIILNNGWSDPKSKMMSGLSMLLNLNQEVELISKGLTKNWRRNLKRFKEDELIVEEWNDPDIEQLLGLYNKMTLYKNIGTQHTRESLSSLFKYFGKDIIIFRCVYNHELIGIRAALIQGDKGWDLLAAADQVARKKYVSHKLFWLLLMKSRELGVKTYNLSGIAPDTNKGVYNFKKGTGAIEVKYLGEWEWASSWLIKTCINYAIKFKKDTY